MTKSTDLKRTTRRLVARLLRRQYIPSLSERLGIWDTDARPGREPARLRGYPADFGIGIRLQHPAQPRP